MKIEERKEGGLLERISFEECYSSQQAVWQYGGAKNIYSSFCSLSAAVRA